MAMPKRSIPSSPSLAMQWNGGSPCQGTLLDQYKLPLLLPPLFLVPLPFSDNMTLARTTF